MNPDHQNGNESATGARTEAALPAAGLSYRRLFETAQDGILILEADTGQTAGPPRHQIGMHGTGDAVSSPRTPRNFDFQIKAIPTTILAQGAKDASWQVTKQGN